MSEGLDDTVNEVVENMDIGAQMGCAVIGAVIFAIVMTILFSTPSRNVNDTSTQCTKSWFTGYYNCR